VLPESSPGVALLIGEHSRAQSLYEDWILVHELFHLGVPSYQNEGKWFDEGLATYFEPIIRVRAGYKREQDVWSEFAHEMPRGLRAVNEYGLERAQSFDDIYWGGAIVLLLADIEIRKRTDGARGIEDGLRGVLEAGGTANQVWTLDRTLKLADQHCGGDTLQAMAKRHATRGSRVDLDAVFRELGVEVKPDGVVLHDDAPLAKIRHALMFGEK
jgi:predicted metalloprotease with PDZ domain